jgi:hypothetical protein
MPEKGGAGQSEMGVHAAKSSQIDAYVMHASNMLKRWVRE